MADAEAVNGVAAGSIEAINGVAKASIEAINGAGIPAAGATLWTLVAADGGVGTAAASDLNAWTCYISADMSTQDYNSVAYGQDGSGGPMWVAVNSNNTKDIRWTADPTAGIDAWGNKNPTNTMLGVTWSNGVWLTVGANGAMWRSTTGSGTWTEVDLSGVTGWANDETIYEVVGDGAGSFMFAHGMNTFVSTDDGSSWARCVDLSASPISLSGYIAYTMAYTASRWCVFLRKTSQSRVFHAAADATGTWTGATVGGSGQSGQTLVSSTARRMAAGAGTVIIVSSNDTSRSTNGGQDWPKNSHDLPRTAARDVATDGQGNWVAVHDSGRVSISTDDGANWAEQTGVQDGGSNTNMRFPSGGANVENLDSIAANVLLPV